MEIARNPALPAHGWETGVEPAGPCARPRGLLRKPATWGEPGTPRHESLTVRRVDAAASDGPDADGLARHRSAAASGGDGERTLHLPELSSQSPAQGRLPAGILREERASPSWPVGPRRHSTHLNLHFS